MKCATIVILIECVYFSCPLIEPCCNRHDFRRLVYRQLVPKLIPIEAKQAEFKYVFISIYSQIWLKQIKQCNMLQLWAVMHIYGRFINHSSFAVYLIIASQHV